MKKIKKLSLNKKKVAQLNDAQLESLIGGKGAVSAISCIKCCPYSKNSCCSYGINLTK